MEEEKDTMSRICTICSHPERAQIEASVVAGMSNRLIASQFNVGYKSIERHSSEHIAQAIQRSAAAKEEVQSLNVVRQLQVINNISLAILREARDAKDSMLVLHAVDRVSKQLELQAKLLGDINDSPQINIRMNPEWQEIEDTIFKVLEPFVEVRIAVAAALVAMSEHKQISQ